ncbi:hypothetical protein M501DRAFT_934256 [Patellaria atrata CBS 101060]|uniref:CENP-V/GFA domain-containing protein n=1 Tax=Patellaria atrata CBS 101060 TaxID=1346257 RepID=A0A9P4SB44_9PEZI|nr:hypothetical protein M501DRAFT_934256 [Patellaria atrata CBS 101060]
MTTLHGSCACGRNRYLVSIPSNSAQALELIIDNSLSNRRHQATPFTPFLRIPLSWYHSSTYAYYPDETHRTIRRTFHTPPSTLRQFCGYCGTQLSSWHERTRADAERISLTLGSVDEDDVVGMLRELGVRSGLSSEAASEAEEEVEQEEVFPAVQRIVHHSPYLGAPWFESLVSDSRLGRLKRQKGGHTSADGNMSVEWEVVEWTEGDDDAQPNQESSVGGKRKIRDIEVDG